MANGAKFACSHARSVQITKEGAWRCEKWATAFVRLLHWAFGSWHRPTPGKATRLLNCAWLWVPIGGMWGKHTAVVRMEHVVVVLCLLKQQNTLSKHVSKSDKIVHCMLEQMSPTYTSLMHSICNGNPCRPLSWAWQAHLPPNLQCDFSFP